MTCDDSKLREAAKVLMRVLAPQVPVRAGWRLRVDSWNTKHQVAMILDGDELMDAFNALEDAINEGQPEKWSAVYDD